jgi:SNF2 family DNA or RNA helicase
MDTDDDDDDESECEGEEDASISAITCPLHPYQLEFLSWASGRKGGILADEMGLGKTLQILALCLSEWVPFCDDRRILVLCPLTAISAWQSEIAARVLPERCGGPRISTCVYDTGYALDRSSNVVLSTYDAVKRFYRDGSVPYSGADLNPRASSWTLSTSFPEHLLQTGPFPDASCPGAPRALGSPYSIAWDALIMDEGHRCSNHNTTVHKAVAKIFARNRWLLTGTPIQNSPQDLLAALRLSGCVTIPPTRQWAKLSANYDKDEDVQRRIETWMAQNVLRRTKDGVGDFGIGMRREFVYSRNFAFEEERAFFAELHERMRAVALEIKSAKNAAVAAAEEKARNKKSTKKKKKRKRKRSDPEDEGEPKEKDTRQSKLLSLIMECRLASIDPALCDASLRGKEWTGIKSAKMRMVRNILIRLRPGERFLIFSSFKKALDLVADLLKELGLDYDVIDGSKKRNSRATSVSNFDEGKVRGLLITLKTGGESLTLVNATRVIFLEPWWNPQAEAQAASRAHRLGQRNEVRVTWCLLNESMDVVVYHKGIGKGSMAEIIVDGQISNERYKSGREPKLNTAEGIIFMCETLEKTRAEKDEELVFDLGQLGDGEWNEEVVEHGFC